MTTKPFAFISYHTESTISFVEELSHELTNLGINHWYAKRDIAAGASYAEVIPSVIQECSLVVFLLNKFSNESHQVRNEFLKAYDLKKDILVVKIDDFKESDVFSFLRSSVQFLEVYDFNNTLKIKSICKELNKYFSNNIVSSDCFSPHLDRESNTINFYAYEQERNRLSVQRNLLTKFAKESIDQITKRYDQFSILDIGCNTGDFCLELFQHPDKRKHYVGVDKEEGAIEYAKTVHTEAPEKFYCANCEDHHGFNALLNKIEQELDIDSFDIIFLSMVLLHIKNPRAVLDVLRNHLSPNGTLIILDIDDGLNIAYPDPRSLFQKAVEICEYTSFSGYRKSGREILSYLTELDMKNIRLHKSGISTTGMSRKERDDFFNIYFWFIMDDLKQMHQNHPESTIIKADLKWMMNNYEEMQLNFKKKEFFFNLGFMLYSAESND